MLKQKKPQVVEIEYYPGTERIMKVIPRSYDDTKKTYLDMGILTSAGHE